MDENKPMKSNDRLLIIDSEFRDLIRPLMKDDYIKLEDSVRKNGCRKPLLTWNGIIVDGHKRYQICLRYGLPYETELLEFKYREEAIVWICRSQCARRDITEEARRYLIGRQFEAQKTVTRLLNKERYEEFINQVSAEGKPYETYDPTNPLRKNPPVKIPVSKQVGKEYHVAPKTVEKYGRYSRALDYITTIDPNLFNKILSGRYKIAFEAVIELSRLEAAQIRSFGRRLKKEHLNTAFVPYGTSRHEIQVSTKEPSSGAMFLQTAVKNTPDFDPDAELNSLLFTIPVWIKTMTRAIEKTNMSLATPEAREKAAHALGDLRTCTEKTLMAVKEGYHEL